MPVDVITTVEIEKPVALVASFSADPDNAPTWYVNIKSVEWQTEPPLRLGSRVAFVAYFLGKRLAYTYEVKSWAENETLVMRADDGPFPMETSYVWEALGENRTRMTLRNRGVPKGFSRLVTPFMAAAMRRANRKDLARLKEKLEQAA